jgi:hypothetical protein
VSDHVDLGIAVLVGAVVGTGGYLLASPLLAVHLALLYAVLAWLFVNYRHEIPEGGNWRVARWNGLFTLVVTLGGFAVLNDAGGSLGHAFAVAAVVYAVGCLGYLVALATLADERTVRAESAETSEKSDA